jgi:peptide subunit release factor 1 (eRF1)
LEETHNLIKEKQQIDAIVPDILSSLSRLLRLLKKEATLGYIRQNEFEVLKEITSIINLNHIPGDRSQIKIFLMKEAEMAFHRRICEIMNETFLEFEGLKRIFVGGSEPIEEKIVKNDILDNRLEGEITFISVSSDKGREGIEEFFTEIRKILIK